MNTQAISSFRNFSGKKHWLIMGLAASLALTGGIFVFNPASIADQAPLEKRLVVSSQKIEMQPGFHTYRYFSAQVQSQQSVAIASEIPGKVIKLLVDDGDLVEEGEVLFELDTQLLKQQKAGLLAQKESVEADKSLAKKRLSRQKNLKKQSFSAEDTIDALDSQIEKLSATLRNLQAQIEDIDIRLGKSSIKAPFKGQIQERLVDTGAVINAGTPALQLLDHQSLEVQVGLPVALASQINKQQNYQMLKGDTVVNAKVIAVLPKIDPITQTQGVKLSVAQNSSLVPGDFIKFQLQSFQSSQGFWLANSALIEGERGLWQIFVIDPEGRVNKQSVSIIYPSNPASFVSANLESGQKVVINGVHRLANRVAVVEAEVTNQSIPDEAEPQQNESYILGAQQ